MTKPKPKKPKRPGRPPLDRPAYKRMSIALPGDVVDWIHDYADRDGCSYSEVILGCVLLTQAEHAKDALQVIHCDGDPLNNDIGNLELRVTRT